MDELRDLITQIDFLKKENKTLKENNALSENFGKEYLDLFQTMNEGIALNELLYDENGNAIDYIISKFNPSYQIIIGRNQEEIINKQATEVFNTQQAPFIEIFSRVAETGTPATLESYFAPCKKYFRISVYSPAKKKFTTVFEDITHRKNMEKALRERIISLTQPIDDLSNVHFADLFDLDEIQTIQDTFAKATGVASIITEPDGTPITSPSNFCNLCTNIIRKSPKGLANCIRSDSIIGKSGNKPNIQLCLSGGLYDGGASITVGNRHLANWLIGQVFDENTNLDIMRSYAREIEVDENLFLSELKNVHKMSKEQFKTVSQALFLIAKQISDLALNNLQQARAISEKTKVEERIKILNSELFEKNRELEQIVYVASHDLRSPLVSIQSFGKDLKADFDEIRRCAIKETDPAVFKHKVEAILKNKMEDSFNYIFRNTRKMDLLVSGLLRLSRLERCAFSKSIIKMNNLVLDVIKNFETQLDENNFEVVIETLPDCIGDEFMLNQVIMNLVDNAIKYRMPEKKGSIRISGRCTYENIVYCVKDNGKGIAKENQEKVFDLFRRIDPDLPGEGLGLTIVKKITEMHNGSFWVESDLGEGSSFYFSLPLIKG